MGQRGPRPRRARRRRGARARAGRRHRRRRLRPAQPAEHDRRAFATQLAATGQRCPETPIELARVIFDSLALGYARVVAAIERLTGEAIARHPRRRRRLAQRLPEPGDRGRHAASRCWPGRSRRRRHGNVMCRRSRAASCRRSRRRAGAARAALGRARRFAPRESIRWVALVRAIAEAERRARRLSTIPASAPCSDSPGRSAATFSAVAAGADRRRSDRSRRRRGSRAIARIGETSVVNACFSVCSAISASLASCMRGKRRAVDEVRLDVGAHHLHRAASSATRADR